MKPGKRQLPASDRDGGRLGTVMRAPIAR